MEVEPCGITFTPFDVILFNVALKKFMFSIIWGFFNKFFFV